MKLEEEIDARFAVVQEDISGNLVFVVSVFGN